MIHRYCNYETLSNEMKTTFTQPIDTLIMKD
jgi:hypothetical protein